MSEAASAPPCLREPHVEEGGRIGNFARATPPGSHPCSKHTRAQDDTRAQEYTHAPTRARNTPVLIAVLDNTPGLETHPCSLLCSKHTRAQNTPGLGTHPCSLPCSTIHPGSYPCSTTHPCSYRSSKCRPCSNSRSRAHNLIPVLSPTLQTGPLRGTSLTPEGHPQHKKGGVCVASDTAQRCCGTSLPPNQVWLWLLPMG